MREVTATTNEDAREVRVEEARAALTEVRQRREHATAEERKAAQRLEEIGVQKDELAAGVFSGDPDATQRYNDLEEEERIAIRALAVAQAAGEEFEGEIEAATKELEAAEFAVAKRQATERREALNRLQARRDKAADALEVILEEEEKSFFPDRSRREINTWLKKRYQDRLRSWLR